MAVKQPSAALHACIIRAASLEYRYQEIEDDVVLTTCESLNFGGQVEPTQAELDEYDHVWVRTQSLRQQTCARLTVSGALSDANIWFLTVRMAVCVLYNSNAAPCRMFGLTGYGHLTKRFAKKLLMHSKRLVFVRSFRIRMWTVSQTGWQCPRPFSISSVLTVNASKAGSATSWQAIQSWQADLGS